MIPDFPTFKLLELTDQEQLIAICHQFEPYSDFNFSSLWSWNIKENIEVAKLGEGLVIKAPDYISGQPTLSVIGSIDGANKLFQVLSYAQQQALDTTVKLVPHVLINSMPEHHKSQFSITEDRDNHDYVLETREIAAFEGKKYYDKRNLVNRFNRFYPQHEVHQLDLSDVTTQVKVMEVFESWVSNHSQFPEDADNERIAIQRVLRYANALGIRGLGITVDGALIAFATYEKDTDYGFISFEKAIKDFDGVYAYLNHLTAKELLAMDCTYINFEQDLGIPGLRTAKELWRPVRFLNKYTVTAKLAA